MRLLRKLLAILVTIIAVLVVVFIVMKVFLGNTMPSGEDGPRAERLADDMLKAMNYEAYQQLEEIRWTFRDSHHFVWRKKVDSVTVKWDDYKAIFCTKTLDGEASLSGKPLTGKLEKKALNKAWELFANDSFWLVAPFKIRDPGTSRELVSTAIGNGLLVTYSSGGVTPGDSYLWILNAQNRPVAWQMWVSILPIGGLEFSWENWKQYEGVWLATDHQGPGPISVDITNLEVE